MCVEGVFELGQVLAAQAFAEPAHLRTLCAVAP